MHYRPRRSALYMPGANPRALEKAQSLPADVLILDLEDAVAPDAKDAARERVCRALSTHDYRHCEVVVRINALTSPWGAADLRAAAAAAPNAILTPKPARAEDIVGVSAAMDAAGASSKTRLWAMVETPLAILNLAEIAAAARQTRLECLVLGTNDLVKETRADLSEDPTAALYWSSVAITAARAWGLDALDGVYNDFRDAQGFDRACRLGRRLGFDGKTLIHPDQIAAANAVFAPSAEEVAFARKIIAALEEPGNAGKGVVSVDGRMVELLHAEMARRTLAIAEAIAARSR